MAQDSPIPRFVSRVRAYLRFIDRIGPLARELVLGAVAELERAKIIELTTHGRFQRLHIGELSSNGRRIYGYDYVRKTAAAPAALVINEEQAPVVRSIFEMFASRRFGLVTISPSLEERCVPTRLDRPQWDRGQIKAMLKNETYSGTRYFNRIIRATEAFCDGRADIQQSAPELTRLSRGESQVGRRRISDLAGTQLIELGARLSQRLGGAMQLRGECAHHLNADLRELGYRWKNPSFDTRSVSGRRPRPPWRCAARRIESQSRR
jgi:hypothetical protein